jgi:hypothetical protein
MDANAEAAAALAAMRESRERLARAIDCPPERHLAFAALMGGLVACQAAAPMFTLLIEAALLVGLVLLIAWDRRRTGMFINGYRAGRTIYVTLALLVFTLAMLGLTVWLKEEHGLVWAPLAGGALVAAVAYPASTIWQRIYLRELRRAP